jgi:hypothetical protein
MLKFAAGKRAQILFSGFSLGVPLFGPPVVPSHLVRRRQWLAQLRRQQLAQAAFRLGDGFGFHSGAAGKRSDTYLGTITKRPRVRGPLFFLCFSRGRRTQPNLARVPLLYVPFDFFLAFFFMTLFLAVGPLSQSKQWQQADERGVNRSWQRGNNIETAPWGTFGLARGRQSLAPAQLKAPWRVCVFHWSTLRSLRRGRFFFLGTKPAFRP